MKIFAVGIATTVFLLVILDWIEERRNHKNK